MPCSCCRSVHHNITTCRENLSRGEQRFHNIYSMVISRTDVDMEEIQNIIILHLRYTALPVLRVMAQWSQIDLPLRITKYTEEDLIDLLFHYFNGISRRVTQYAKKPKLQVITDLSENNKEKVITFQECSICYESSNIETQCGHHFCKCLMEWIEKNKKNEDVTCPCCRTSLKKVVIYEIN